MAGPERRYGRSVQQLGKLNREETRIRHADVRRPVQLQVRIHDAPERKGQHSTRTRWVKLRSNDARDQSVPIGICEDIIFG